MENEQPFSSETLKEASAKLNKYFRAAAANHASDLHLKAGQPPKLRIRGQLKDTSGEIMTKEFIAQTVTELLSPQQKEVFKQNGTLDFAYELDDQTRFRINIFHQRGTVSMSARRVESIIPRFEQINLPKTLEKIADRNQGLVLVVGPTGAGKTTTIVSMIDFINRTRSCHIITIEDPIEFVFKDKKAIISQREIGIDVPDYNEALKYLMRQDPDVVFIGEMRDAATVTAGMRAAQTGHLVFGTIHSANAAQAVSRLLDLFPQNERDQVRKILSLSMKAVISQFLLPCIKEGIDQIPAIEIMLANPEVRKLIADGRENNLSAVIKACQEEGMVDITENLCRLIKQGYVDPKEGIKYAPNPDELKMTLKGIRTTATGIM
jgi:twitching motility protein PilT